MCVYCRDKGALVIRTDMLSSQSLPLLGSWHIGGANHMENCYFSFYFGVRTRHHQPNPLPLPDSTYVHDACFQLTQGAR